MKVIVLALAISCSVLTNAQLVITEGTQFTLGSNVALTLHNTDLINNGTFNAGNAHVHFTGNLTSLIGGTQPLQFQSLRMNKNSGAKLVLQKDIAVRESIHFSAGILDLNHYTIDLGSTGLLVGEKEDSHITGTAGGEVMASAVLNSPAGAHPGNLGAVISSSQNLGNVVIKRGHVGQTNSWSNGSSILRYYTISPHNNAALNATLRFHYLDSELNGLPEGALTLWRSINNLNWTNEGVGTFSSTGNYVEQTGISSFSRWTLSTANNALPVLFTQINVQCKDEKVVVHWKTAQEQNSSHFIIETSSDAAQWKAAGTMPAAGNSTIEQHYSFTDNSPVRKNYYRIVQYDRDGRAHFTRVLNNPCSLTDHLAIWPNPFRDKLFININATISSQAMIRFYDARGVLIKTIRYLLMPGTNQISVDLQIYSAGPYTVTAEWNEGSEKKIRQVVKQ